MVIGPTHVNGGTFDLLMTDVLDLVNGGTFDLLMTDVLDLVQVTVVVSLGDAPNLCVSRLVFVKDRDDWTEVCGAYVFCLDEVSELLTILLRFSVSISPCKSNVLLLLFSSVCITRISLGLMMTAGVRSTSNSRLMCGGLVIALKLTRMSVLEETCLF